MKTCAASSCTNTSYNSPHLTWHSLPQDDFVRDDWMELLGIPDDDEEMDPPKVCSSHFKTADFLSNNRFLKSAARPSLRLAKTAKVQRRREFEEDYVASSNESDDEVAVIIEQTKKPEQPTSTRPSRKAAQKAAEKLKRYCYSPPGSPSSPSESAYKPSYAETSTSARKPQNRKVLQKVQQSTPSTSTHVPKSYYSTNSGQTVNVMQGNVKFTPITPVRTGLNVTQLPIKPFEVDLEEVTPPRRCPIFERTGIHMSLQMECYEELLAPAQVAKHQKMQAEAESFNQTLRSLRANNIPIIHHTDPFVKVTNTVTIVKSNMTNGIGGSSAVTKTTDVVKTTPAVGVVTPQILTSATTFIQQPTMVIAQTSPQIQILRPGLPQPTLLLSGGGVVASPTMTLTPGLAPAGQSYKVLVDSRTGVVVGTVPDTAVSLPQPVVTNIIQPSTSQATVTVVSTSMQPPATTESVPLVKPREPIVPTELPTDGCVFRLKGDSTDVTAESLLNIKAISGSLRRWTKAVFKSTLKDDLVKENFFSDPLQWLLKMNLIATESGCRSCGIGRFALVADGEAIDGYKWLCNKQRCGKSIAVQRLYFFSRFGCTLNRLLPLVYHWALQTDVNEVKNILKIDTYLIRSVWRALQEVCTRAVVIKAKKLGGPGKVVEIVTAKLGPNFWIIAAMERKTGYVRMKVLHAEGDWNSFANLQKVLEPWLTTKSVIMSPEVSLRGLSRIGFIFTLVDKEQPQQQQQVLIHACNMTKYVRKHLKRMFGSFKLTDLKLDTVQGFLDELQWRNRFGKTPRDTFCCIFKDIAEQSGRMVAFPPLELSGHTPTGQPQVTMVSSDSSTTESDSEDENSPSSPSEISATFRRKSASTMISSVLAAHNMCVTTHSSSAVAALKPKLAPATVTPAPKPITVVLDSYYYATKKPDPELEVTDTKGNYQFKCIVCKKIIDNNLKIMKHIVAHMEDSKQKNFDLSDLTQCKYCFRDFDTPFSMQCHMESVHLNTSSLSCQICNHAFDSKSRLTVHMRAIHVKAEMPYFCEVCNYRSSFHRDVLDHFQQAHNNTDKLLCHFCLRVYSTRFSGVEQLGYLQNFYYHLYKHQCKSTVKKCNACCLVFPTVVMLKKHKTQDHVSFENDKSITYGTPKPDQEVIYIKNPHLKGKITRRVGRPSKYSKPMATHSDEDESYLSGNELIDMESNREGGNTNPIIVPSEYTHLTCVECKSILEPEHLSKNVSCSKCKYSTFCCKAYVEHMITEHAQLSKKRPSLFTFTHKKLESPLFCPCGFKTVWPNNMANHLQKCRRKTCYPDFQSAVNSLVKLEHGSPPLESGSAFFPPLIVLDENEEDYVNQTLSTIPEPEEPGIKPLVPSRRKRQRDSSDDPSTDPPPRRLSTSRAAPVVDEVKEPSPKKRAVEEEAPNWLNALGLVRRPEGSDKEAERKTSNTKVPTQNITSEHDKGESKETEDVSSKVKEDVSDSCEAAEEDVSMDVSEAADDDASKDVIEAADEEDVSKDLSEAADDDVSNDIEAADEEEVSKDASEEGNEDVSKNVSEEADEEDVSKDVSEEADEEDVSKDVSETAEDDVSKNVSEAEDDISKDQSGLDDNGNNPKDSSRTIDDKVEDVVIEDKDVKDREEDGALKDNIEATVEDHQEVKQTGLSESNKVVPDSELEAEESTDL